MRGRHQWHATGEAWTVVSTLLSGICIFGGAGFGLDHMFGTRPILVAAGLLTGVVLGVYLVYARYFNADAQPASPVASVAGWPKTATVAGAAAEPHPPTPELAQWPHVMHASDPSLTEEPHAS